MVTFWLRNLSRETFGKIYTAITSKKEHGCYNIFDLYDALNLDVNFLTFYAAVVVFKDLEFINIYDDLTYSISSNNRQKKELSTSKVYNSLLDIVKLGDYDVRWKIICTQDKNF